jgi:hypothetical protein
VNDGDATCITVGTAYSGKPSCGGVCKYRMKSFAARKAMLFFSHSLFQPGHNNRGHNDGPALCHTDTNGPCKCMLVQVHALYPEGHGNNGHTVEMKKMEGGIALIRRAGIRTCFPSKTCQQTL